MITYVAVAAGAWFIGGYMVKVYSGERVWLSRDAFVQSKRVTYRIIGVDEEHEQGWIGYLVSILAVTVRGHRRSRTWFSASKITCR